MNTAAAAQERLDNHGADVARAEVARAEEGSPAATNGDRHSPLASFSSQAVFVSTASPAAIAADPLCSSLNVCSKNLFAFVLAD